MVHGIVNTHGGAITVESELGKGTTSHVYFPIIERDEETQEETEGPIPTGNERILFVDDEPIIVEIGKVIDVKERFQKGHRDGNHICLQPKAAVL